KEWKWWSNEPDQLNRPWAAITVLEPSDSFEVVRPEQGVNIRIRCWWLASTSGLKSQITKLKELRIDDQLVEPEPIQDKGRRGRLGDSYYLYKMPNPIEGKHVVSATLINLK